MDKVYKHQEVEQKWYKFWEESGYFTPRVPSGQAPLKRPFTVILPPPNANADLHAGHAMYTIEDIMIRYHRMKGDATLWLPGADHAGFETQYVFEKYLAKSGKSRFDYQRDELYKMIWNFVENNRGNMENQLKRMGFSLDWTRNTFTLDPKIIKIVYKTFKKLYDDGLVYRSKRLVNYCTKDGTSFSDLEVKHIEAQDPLYYLKYGPFVLATVRPETKFGDTAVAVNPHDKRYKKWIGQEIEVEGLTGKFKIKVIGDDAIDPKFGTGVAKVTPAHDMTDFEIAKRHNLPMKQVIGFDGRLTSIAGSYAGLKVKAAREKVVADMMKKGLIDHIDDNYTHTIGVCYKCGTTLEPLPLPQWYIKTKPLTDKAIKIINEKETSFIPKRFEKEARMWLTNFHDWNISRQLVWGIRIPAWKCEECNHDDQWIVTEGEKPERCPVCGGTKLVQDTDTFDTWFSSGQWPFATLLKTGNSNFQIKDNRIIDHDPLSDFNYFYPTSVMETAYDILAWWVCRMIMLGVYMTGKTPFNRVYLHGLVRDAKGQKMSKSKGNVINPIIMIDQYGADSLRFALVYGNTPGRDFSLSEDKVRGMRNFSNKLWNIGRFIKMNMEFFEKNNIKVIRFDTAIHKEKYSPEDKKILSDLLILEKTVTKNMENYRFDKAAERLYEFIWHSFADKYIERSKEKLKANDQEKLAILIYIFQSLLKLLHPFMPFITEELQKQLIPHAQPLIISGWPQA